MAECKPQDVKAVTTPQLNPILMRILNFNTKTDVKCTRITNLLVYNEANYQAIEANQFVV